MAFAASCLCKEGTLWQTAYAAQSNLAFVELAILRSRQLEQFLGLPPCLALGYELGHAGSAFHLSIAESIQHLVGPLYLPVVRLKPYTIDKDTCYQASKLCQSRSWA